MKIALHEMLTKPIFCENKEKYAVIVCLICPESGKGFERCLLPMQGKDRQMKVWHFFFFIYLNTSKIVSSIFDFRFSERRLTKITKQTQSRLKGLLKGVALSISIVLECSRTSMARTSLGR